MRITQLDGLRGIAALAVMGFHLTAQYPKLFGHETLPFHFTLGQYGVQLFFAISGFVILMTLNKIKVPMDFVVSRFSRLYPTYWAAMFITALVLVVLPVSTLPVTGMQVMENMLMFQGLFKIVPVDGVYWTLEVELIFYVLMLLLWVCGALRRPLLCAALWLLPAIGSRLIEIPWTVVQLTMLLCIPWFALGMAAYAWHAKLVDYKLWPIVAGLSILAILISDGVWMAGFAGAVFVLVTMAAQGALPFLGSRMFVFFGVISYSLYLIHQHISYAVLARLEGFPGVVKFIIPAGISIALAYLIHIAVEKPSISAIRARYRSRGPVHKKRWAAGIAAMMGAVAVGMRLAL